MHCFPLITIVKFEDELQQLKDFRKEQKKNMATCKCNTKRSFLLFSINFTPSVQIKNTCHFEAASNITQLLMDF